MEGNRPEGKGKQKKDVLTGSKFFYCSSKLEGKRANKTEQKYVWSAHIEK
jgi:hypothetical protein